MAYPLKKNTTYNLVLIHPAKPSHATGVKTSWTRKGDREEMLAFYGSWSPVVKKWLHQADEDLMEWTLCGHPELPT